MKHLLKITFPKWLGGLIITITRGDVAAVAADISGGEKTGDAIAKSIARSIKRGL